MASSLVIAGTTGGWAQTFGAADLPAGISWAAACRLVDSTGTLVEDLTTAMSQTAGLWTLTISFTAAQSAAWAKAGFKSTNYLYGDVKIFNSAASDPVIRTTRFTIEVAPAITP